MSLVVFAHNYGEVQLPIFCFVNIISVLYITIVRPYKAKVTNIEDIINEIILTTILFLFFFFINKSSELDSSGRPYIVGWI